MDDSQHETIGGKSVRVAYPAESGNDDIFWSYSLSSWTNWWDCPEWYHIATAFVCAMDYSNDYFCHIDENWNGILQCSTCKVLRYFFFLWSIYANPYSVIFTFRQPLLTYSDFDRSESPSSSSPEEDNSCRPSSVKSHTHRQSVVSISSDSVSDIRPCLLWTFKMQTGHAQCFGLGNLWLIDWVRPRIHLGEHGEDGHWLFEHATNSNCRLHG